MLINNDELWAGTDSSLTIALEADAGVQARMRADQYEKPDESPLLTVSEGLGVISVKGSLTNHDSPFNALFGVVSYPEIRAALVQAANDPNVKHILMDYDTGGGAVSGLADTAALVRMVNDKIKPITAYAENAYSAGYWLAASAGKVFAGEGSGVGSIGIIAHHVERSKQLEAEGVKVTVLRAGTEKALANSVEPLTAKAEAQLQARLDVMYKMFVRHVADMRGKTYDFTDKHLANGKEFMGRAAFEIGMTDGMKTFDTVVSEIKKKLIDPSANSMDNRGKQNNGLRTENQGDAVMAGKKSLTESDIAALAAGVSLDAAATPAEPVAEVVAEVEAVAEAPAEVVAEVDTSAQTLKFVSDQLKASQDDLMAARIALSKAEDKVAELSAVVSPLKDIAAKAVNNMRVALRGSAIDMGAQSATQVVAEYQAVSLSFAEQYKAGGVSATTATAVKEVANEQKVDARTQARLNAVRFPK